MSSITIDPSRINSFQNISINNTNTNHKNRVVNSNSSITGNKNKKESSLMQNLLKQKQELNEEKQALAEKKMDAKEKKVKMDELNKKLKDVESQIQQLKVQEKQDELQKKQEELQKKQAKEETYTKTNPKTNGDVILSASLSELINIKGSKEAIHLLKDSKNRQTIEAEYIEPNNIPNSYDNNRLSEIGTSIANIDMTISKKIGDLSKVSERIQAKTELALKQLEDNDNNKASDDLETNDNNSIDGSPKNTVDSKTNVESQDTDNNSKVINDNQLDNKSKI